MAKKRVGYGAFFCWNCGTPIEKGKENCIHCGMPYSGEERYGNISALGAGGVGWSDMVNSSFFRKYAGGYGKASLVWLIGLSIIIPGALILSGEVNPKGDGLIVLIVVPLIFWVVALLFLRKKFDTREGEWEGVVEGKFEEQKTRMGKNANNSRREDYIEYVITVREKNGDTRCLVDKDNASRYLYFNVGDRIRFHSKKYLKYIEKYDKSRDLGLFCAACGSFNDSRDNYCERCGAPMFKGNLKTSFSNEGAEIKRTNVYCENCGTKLTDGKFCESCGQKVV